MKFSANLGFLWADRPLTDAIHAAHAAGFDAVECHWPYATDPAAVAAALRDTGLQMLGLNTSRGDISLGENGLSALPDRISEARDAIDQAITYARAIRTPNIHVMAGFASGDAAPQTFVDNLRYACDRAAPHGITILIEPLNAHDAPGYYLNNTSQAAEIISETDRANLRLMFDVYHIQRTEGDALDRLPKFLPLIGHIQFATAPDRSAPAPNDPFFARLFAQIAALGYEHPLGAEYKPGGDTDATLGWLAPARAIAS